MGRPTIYDHNAMQADRAAGMTFAEIAAKHGCKSVSTVHAAVGGAKAGPKPDPSIPIRDDLDMDAISTAVFRKVLGYCPIADGPRL